MSYGLIPPNFKEETAVTDSTDRSTSSAVYTDVTSETITFTLNKQSLVIATYNGTLSNSGAPAGKVAMTDGSNNILAECHIDNNAAGSSADRFPVALHYIGKMAAGAQTIKIRFLDTNGRTTLIKNTATASILRVAHEQ